MDINFVDKMLILGTAFIAVAGLLFWRVINYKCRLQELQTEQDHLLKSIEAKLNQFDSIINDTRRQLTIEFGSDKEEPYISKVQDLKTLLGKCEKDHLTYLQQTKELKQNYPAPIDNRVSHILTIKRQVNLWQNYLRLINIFYETDIASIEAKQLKLQGQLQELHELPVSVAKRTQQIYEDSSKILDLIEQLVQQGVRGDKLNQIKTPTQQIQNSISLLPACFLDIYGTEVKQRATKIDIINVWAILERDEPIINNRLKQAQALYADYRDLGDGLQGVRQSTAAAEQAITLVSKSVKPDRYQETLAHLKRVSTALSAQYQSLEIEAFGNFIERVSEIRKIAGTLLKEISDAQQQVEKLQKAITHNAIALTALKKKMGQADQVEPSIMWEAGQQELRKVQQQIDRLGSVNRQRNSQQLLLNYEETQEIKNTIEKIDKLVDQVLRQYQDLTPVLKNILLDRADWSVQAQLVSDKISYYGSKNWSKHLQVTQISRDAKDLETERQNLLGNYKTSEPLPESWLIKDERFSSLLTLIKKRDQFFKRLDDIEHEFSLIHNKNETAKNEFESTIEAIEQLENLSLHFSNPNLALLIQKLVASRSKYEKKLSRLFLPQNTDLVGKQGQRD